MKDSEQLKKKVLPKSLTIGLIGDKLTYDIPILYFRAVKEVTLRHRTNMLYYSAQPIRSPFDYSIQSNILYDLVSKQNIDGIIIASNIVASCVPSQELLDLCHKYHPLPVVSMGIAVEGIPSVVIDNNQGMYEAISHLIKVHGYKHIAYLVGPGDHPDAKERYQAYTQALKDNNLALDPELILSGDFHTPSGNKAISTLIDDRKRKPGRDFHAFVCANDYMAFGVITELQNRGIRVPEDIAVVGFDDIYISRYYTPTLSTVHQFFGEVGKQAAELLLDRIAGKQIPDIVKIPAKYVQRQSCGCKDSEVAEKGYAVGLPANVSNIIYSDPQKFMNYVSRQAYDSGLPRQELIIWDPVFSILRHPEQWDWGNTGKNKTFGQYAWAIMGKASYLMFKNINSTKLILNTGTVLSSTLDISELKSIIVNELPKYGIRKCYLALYENPPPYTYPQTPPKWSRLILAFDENGRIELPPEGLLFPTRNLVPEEILKQPNQFRMILEALYFREEQIGFWLLDVNVKDEKVCPILSNQISGSLKGALLLKRFQERTRELAIANNEIQILNRQLKDENLRISTEMEVARHIQIALLPEVIKNIHPDFEITARMLTAAEVGGDYYDISLDLEGKLWLGIGDVSGHGVTSGLIMMMAQTVHTTITTNYNASPREIVTIVNNVLFKNIYGRMGESRYMTFATLKYLGQGWFQYAGMHLDLLIYRQRTKTCELIETTGMWMNVKPDIREYTKNEEFRLDVGDLLILFTDGLTEVFNKDKKLLDINGFTEIIAAHAVKEVEAMEEGIFKDVTAWCDGEPRDDMSLIILRRVR